MGEGSNGATLSEKRFDLCSYSFEDCMIETLAWLKALPMKQASCENLRLLYMRFEMKPAHTLDLLSLLKVSNTCTKQHLRDFRSVTSTAIPLYRKLLESYA